MYAIRLQRLHPKKNGKPPANCLVAVGKVRLQHCDIINNHYPSQQQLIKVMDHREVPCLDRDFAYGCQESSLGSDFDEIEDLKQGLHRNDQKKVEKFSQIRNSYQSYDHTLYFVARSKDNFYQREYLCHNYFQTLRQHHRRDSLLESSKVHIKRIVTTVQVRDWWIEEGVPPFATAIRIC